MPARSLWLSAFFAVFPFLCLGVPAPEPTYDKILCVGDVVWKIQKPEIKNYGVEIFVLPETAKEGDYKQALYKTVTDSMETWQAWIVPGTYKFVAKYFNFKKEIRTVYFVMSIKPNKRIRVMPTIEIGNK